MSRVALYRPIRVAITTLHAALRALVAKEVLPVLTAGNAPFTTVVIDEAGLVGRALAAAVGLLASRRVVLVGDPRQLSPISRAARTLAPDALQWLASSGLEHLRSGPPPDHVQHLLHQRRMHPQIRAAISAFQYGGRLLDDPAAVDRPWPGAGTLAKLPRLLWYDLDSDPTIDPGASPGPGGRSRLRPGTQRLLQHLVTAQPELRATRGLFISPFRAQAEAAHGWLQQLGLDDWQASTVHAQQGAEADVVVFDTVFASSTGWRRAEWCRLVNVGLSRARELVILVATRAELEQAWIAPLLPHLHARVLRAQGDGWAWRTTKGWEEEQDDLFAVPAAPRPSLPTLPGAEADPRLGPQIEDRRSLRSLLSSEQRRLMDRSLTDTGPRLVRGVAGSGKTVVLAHWAVRLLLGADVPSVTITFGNSALKPLLERLVGQAWQRQSQGERPCPWDDIHLIHVRSLLDALERELGLETDPDTTWDYGARARRVRRASFIVHRFDALLIDEAQDLGHEALNLLVNLTRPRQGKRPVLVFYDNAQNVYTRDAPDWKAMGLDMRGRSDVMRESFRSTRPVTEFALNLLHRLKPLQSDPDLRELMRPGSDGRRALHEGQRGGAPWWEARFCAADGQQPDVAVFDTPAEEHSWICELVRHWVEDEAVRPGHIRLLLLRKDEGRTLAARLNACLGPAVVVEHRTYQGFDGTGNSIVVSTPHSFKGYDAELMVVAGADRFYSHTKGETLYAALYVALTRARSHVVVTASRHGNRGLLEALEAVARQQDADSWPQHA